MFVVVVVVDKVERMKMGVIEIETAIGVEVGVEMVERILKECNCQAIDFSGVVEIG